VQLIDRLTLADVSPVQIIDSFEGGVWMVWQYRYDASSCADTVHCTARDSCEPSTRVWSSGECVCVQGRRQDAGELHSRHESSDFCRLVRCCSIAVNFMLLPCSKLYVAPLQ
jgi:hypothetical protein